ncbi:MAG: tetratricopeptide repeat protein [Bacteroidota bacterium]
MMRFYFLMLITLSNLLLMSYETHAQLPWGEKKLSADDYLAMVQQKIREKDYRKAIHLSYLGLDKRPDYIDLHFMQGRAFYLNGQMDSARIKFKYVMNEAPRYRDAYILGTNLEMQMKNPEEATCIINDGLYYFPYERDFMIKKLEVLDFSRDRRAAERYADKLLAVHFTDSVAINYFVSFMMEYGRIYAREGNYQRALDCYSRVLDERPNWKEATDAIVMVQNKRGNKQASMDMINTALDKNPDSYEFLTKKANLLSEMYRYNEALEVTGRLVTKYPGDARAQNLNYETQMAAGRFYMKQDPYLVYQGVLERKPEDKEALNYLINLATARGLYIDALSYENQALKVYPNDEEILQKKVGTLETTKRYSEAAVVTRQLVRQHPGNREYRQMYVDMHLLSGRQNMKTMENDSALADYQRVLAVSPGNFEAISYSADILIQQKKYDEALDMIDEGLSVKPNDESLMFKRAVVLSDAGQLDLASKQAYELYLIDPQNERYKSLAVDIKTANGRKMMQIDDYDGAREEFLTVLEIQPTNVDALNGLINLESGTAHYDTALYYVNRALEPDSTDRDLLLKKSSILESKKQYIPAYTITGNLRQRYPYNTKIKQAHIDLLLASGREYNKQDKYDSALFEFNKVLEIAPRDSNALSLSANSLLALNKDDSALQVTDRALRYYPANEHFTFKRAVILEKMKEYASASLAADSVAKMNPTPDNIDFADRIKALSLKNQFGVMFLYTLFDSNSVLSRASIATLQYMRYIKRGSFGFRLNMAGRPNGTGLQLEGDLNYIHNKKWYSYATAGIANDLVFPSLRLGYSINHNFGKKYTAELGIRYLQFDSIDVRLFAVVASVTRYCDDFWLTGRYYPIIFQSNIFHTAVLTARQFITPGTEWITAAVGVGNSPDEFSRNFQLAQNLGLTTYSYSVGYSKVYKYRNTFSLTGSWYNQQLRSGAFRNQYDIFFMFLRKF